jgi:hypothetical protein
MSDQEYADWYQEHAWNPSRYDGLGLERDLAPADWLEPLLTPRSFTVSMSAPQGYEAYARIFFPFVCSGVGSNGEWIERHVRWREKAQENGKVVHALMEEETIASPSDERGPIDQSSDRLSPEQFHAVCRSSPVTLPRRRAGFCCGTASAIWMRRFQLPYTEGAPCDAGFLPLEWAARLLRRVLR